MRKTLRLVRHFADKLGSYVVGGLLAAQKPLPYRIPAHTFCHRCDETHYRGISGTSLFIEGWCGMLFSYHILVGMVIDTGAKTKDVYVVVSSEMGGER